MLTLASVGPVIPPKAKFDQYIPLDVAWERGRERDVVFWRLITTWSHLDVRLWDQSGRIRDLTIVCAGDVKRRSSWRLPSIAHTRGLPIFRLDERFTRTSEMKTTWVFVEERVEFTVWLGTDAVSITFGSDVAMDHIVTCQNTHFGFDKNGQWRAFVLDGVSETDMKLVESASGRMIRALPRP